MSRRWLGLVLLHLWSASLITDVQAEDGWFAVTQGSVFATAADEASNSAAALSSVPGTWSDPIGRVAERPVSAESVAVMPGPEQGVQRTRPGLTAVRNEQKVEAASTTDTINIDMFVGQVKVMGKVDVVRVANGNGNLIRAEVIDTGELMLIAQSEGSSSVRLWHQNGTQTDYNVRISANDPETRIRPETMVRLKVRMVEFRKSALGKLGIDWSDSINGPAAAIAGDAVGNPLFRPSAGSPFESLPNTVNPVSAYLGLATSITSKINFLASTGDAKTLAEPVLSTMNGGSASFLAGGEVPYPSIGENGQTMVQFKEYGIRLNVSPMVDANGLVRTLIDTEISQIDPAVSVQGTPGLLSRKAQTEVNVSSGETIVISGLLSSESGKDIDKIPGIARVPVLGRLFRSRQARNTVNELVIFVTPEVVYPGQAVLSQRDAGFLGVSEQQASAARRRILPEQ